MKTDGSIRIGTEIETKKFDAQLNMLEQKAEAEQKALERLLSIKQAPDGFQIDQEKLNQQIDITRTNLEKTNNQIINLKTKIQSLNNTSVDTGKNINDNFDKGIKKIKNLALSLFSLRSIYTLVSKASSAYLSQDTELANKLQSTWSALGGFLAPLIEWIGNLVAKAVGYLNVFVKALTGVDYVANANAKALSKQAKAQKDLNKQTFAFDEVNKLNDTSKDSKDNSNSMIFQTPDLDDRIVKKLQDLAYWIKENWSWLKLLGEMFLIVFGAYKIAKLLSNISKLIGSAKGLTGLAGLSSLLNGLLIIGGIAITIYLVGNIIKEVKQLKEDLAVLREKGSESQKKYIQKQTDINKLIQDEKFNRESVNNSLNDNWRWLYMILGLGDEAYKDGEMVLKQSETFLEQEMKIYNQGKLTNEEKKKMLDNMIQQYNWNIKIIEKLEEQGVDTTKLKEVTSKYGENIQKVGTDLGYNNQKLDEMVRHTADSDKNTKGIYDNIKSINDTPLTDKSAVYKITAEAETQRAKEKIADLVKGAAKGIWYISNPTSLISKAGMTIGSWVSKLWGKKMAVGGIVNNPGKGVSLGSVTTGEAGREGVLPLTDESTMSELGREIGKHVVVYNTITNYMDSNRINRILAKSKSVSEFANNRQVS